MEIAMVSTNARAISRFIIVFPSFLGVIPLWIFLPILIGSGNTTFFKLHTGKCSAWQTCIYNPTKRIQA